MNSPIAAALIFSSVLLATGCGPKAVPTSDTTANSDATEADGSAGPKLGDAGSEASDNTAVELPSLGDQLAKMSAEAREKMPAEVMQTLVSGVMEVQASGITGTALNVGDQAVDGELPDAKGNQVKLSDLWGEGPVVIVWYRGGWCPYCNMQLQAMQGALPAIKEAGGTLVAITPETPDNSLSTSEKNELEFVVLSDAGNAVAKKYGVVFKLPAKVSPIYKQFGIDLAKSNGDDSEELPLAATYVIDSTGTIRYAFLDANYTKRAEPAEVVEALKSL